MRASLEGLTRDFAELRAMSSAIKPASELLAESSNPHIREYLIVRRRFDYSALIVALYASFEIFVEGILVSYVSLLAKQESYAKLPRRLTDKHLQRTGAMLAKSKIDEARYPGANPQRLVHNLSRCLAGADDYELNAYAVAAHDNNLRYDELEQLLTLVDATPNSVLKAKSLREWFYAEQQMTGPLPTAVPQTVIEQRLNDFVERRNDVAHRGGNPENRLGVEEMEEMIRFVFALSEAVHLTFVSLYLRMRHVGHSNCERLVVAEGPYAKQYVQVIRPPRSALRLRQPVFALSPSFLARWGTIQSIQIDGQDQETVDANGRENVGIRLDFPAPESAEIYLLSDADVLVWND